MNEDDVVSQSNLVQDIREDQLKWLSRGTGVLVFLLVWLLAALYSSLDGEDFTTLLMVAIAMAAGAGASIYFGNRRGQYRLAVWCYLLSFMVLLFLLLAMSRNQTWAQVVIFTAPMIVMLAGGMLSPVSGLGVCLVNVAVILGAPALNDHLALRQADQLGAILISGLAVLLTFLLSGSTYSIAEWALENYRVSRQQTLELRANRAELERALQARDMFNRQLEEARAAAEEAKRLRGQFLADMSHELRTPLNAILGFSESMLFFPEAYGDQVLPEAYHQDLNQIFTSGNQLLTVINDVLDLAKVDAGKLDLFIRDVSLVPVFEDCIQTMEGLLRNKSVALRLAVPDDLPDARADPSRVRQVIVNLIGNAIKFTDQGAITLGARQEDDRLVVSVTDTGIGISPENQKRIFEEFGQIDDLERPYNPGAGLGLTISKRLVELQQGEIWVESELGAGSTFFFTVPCGTQNGGKD